MGQPRRLAGSSFRCTLACEVVKTVRTSRKGVLVRARVLSFASYGLFVAVFALAENARSEDEAVSAVSPVRLVWEAEPGTETCLSAAELERLVEVELEHSVFG